MTDLKDYGGTQRSETLDEKHMRFQNAERDRVEANDREELLELAQQYASIAKLERSSTAGRQFLNSNFGRFVLERAVRGAEEAKNKMVQLQRSDYLHQFIFDAEFTRLQNDAIVPNLIFTWLDEAIQEARDAGIITEEDENA